MPSKETGKLIKGAKLAVTWLVGCSSVLPSRGLAAMKQNTTPTTNIDRVLRTRNKTRTHRMLLGDNNNSHSGRGRVHIILKGLVLSAEVGFEDKVICKVAASKNIKHGVEVIRKVLEIYISCLVFTDNSSHILGMAFD